MDFINWQADFSVGVQEIDEQHQKIVAIINRLYAMFAAKKIEASELEEIFQELTDYADYHFQTEEKHFTEFNYDKAAPHIEMHNIYRDKIEKLKIKFANDKSSETFFQITDFLREWWVWHINHTDKEYTACFNEHGLS